MAADPIGEPARSVTDPLALLRDQLDHYRDALERKLDGMSLEDLTSSRVPSGWTPLGLLVHLTYVERRWLVWGFLGEPVVDPWGDSDPADDGWAVGPGTYEELLAAFREQVATSRSIVAEADLLDVAATGGRFESDPPNLAWILVHLLQEYARHLGHLDIVRELVDGTTGE
ncbi:uncharacterized protein DUF664 [Mumia flava]|uniref:Uncharacterized protein DUF664 n=1 Tax=Mumia flava TaxID=1348852 RepID=A0A0B2BL60_9ACTN|nr:DinB family protein [Mumia flava]PJJ56287.1 uncharacterized protein DUF664 [Mumia flava]